MCFRTINNALAVSLVRDARRDHKHRFKTIKPYAYKDAATLLEDFWETVDKVLKERGVL